MLDKPNSFFFFVRVKGEIENLGFLLQNWGWWSLKKVSLFWGRKKDLPRARCVLSALISGAEKLCNSYDL